MEEDLLLKRSRQRLRFPITWVTGSCCTAGSFLLPCSPFLVERVAFYLFGSHYTRWNHFYEVFTPQEKKKENLYCVHFLASYNRYSKERSEVRGHRFGHWNPHCLVPLLLPVFCLVPSSYKLAGYAPTLSPPSIYRWISRTRPTRWCSGGW